MKGIKIDRVKPQDKKSVLLVENALEDNSNLKKSLLNCDYIIEHHSNRFENLLAMREQYNPDLIIIKIDSLTTDTLQELAAINQLAPLPILIFATQDNPLLIEKSIKAGVSAYVVNEVQPLKLASLITVTCERFKQTQALRNELEQTKEQLKSRKLVERAKGFIMQQKKISEQQAFTMLRKMAMNNGQSLAVVSKNVIEVHELLNANQY